MSMPSILLAEDDELLSGGIKIALEESGYAVQRVRTGTEADSSLSLNEYDLLILDLGLPRLDGMEVLSRLRARGQTLPVLILTARDAVSSRVSGLDAGANDYLTKPFELIELEARIRALLRKNTWNNRTTVNFGPITLDTTNRVVCLNDVPLELSARELEVLEILLQSCGKVVLKMRMLEKVSSTDTELSANGLEIIVHRLRKKLEGTPVNLRTVRGLGYVIEVQ